MKRVVITGIGAVTPIGNSVSSFWKGLIDGHSGAGLITHFDASKFKTKFACEVKSFPPEGFFDTKEKRIYDRYTQFAIVAADEALKQAGFFNQTSDPYRKGVIWASGNGGIMTYDQEMYDFHAKDHTPHFNPYLMPKILVNMAAGILSMRFDIRGISFAPISACASANSALIEAYRNIRWGIADIILAGGSDAAISPSGIGGFNALRALSTRNDSFHTASCPFDEQRDGFVMGEGAGALVLESLESAEQRGVKPLAEIVGGALTSDAYHLTSTHPEGEGAYIAMQQALNEANLKPKDVDYINAHATGTPVGDISEMRAIERLFNGTQVKVSATKSITGHLLGGAGAVEAIACIKSMEENLMPFTANIKNIAGDMPMKSAIIVDKPIIKEMQVALSNTFGFGGHNAVIVFKKFRKSI